MEQIFINGFKNFIKHIKNQKVNRLFLVCGKSFSSSYLKKDLDSSGIEYTLFNSFSPNPKRIDAQNAVNSFRNSKFQMIAAIGGGSAIDVAKYIKLESGISNVQLAAIPTTAGSGSESTRFIVVYDDNGNKESLGNDSTLPDFVVLEPDTLKTLPSYQRKCTLLDAFCQAIESWWSIKSTPESIGFSKKSIELIMANMNSYISDNGVCNLDRIMLASNYSGRAINITTTTAAHAMSYKLTSIFGIPHGNAVAICLPVIWEKMLKYNNLNLNKTLNDIANFMGFENSTKAIDFFKKMLKDWQITYPISKNKEQDLEILTDSVNNQRLKNNPIVFEKAIIREIYNEVLK